MSRDLFELHYGVVLGRIVCPLIYIHDAAVIRGLNFRGHDTFVDDSSFHLFGDGKWSDSIAADERRVPCDVVGPVSMRQPPAYSDSGPLWLEVPYDELLVTDLGCTYAILFLLVCRIWCFCKAECLELTKLNKVSIIHINLNKLRNYFWLIPCRVVNFFKSHFS